MARLLLVAVFALASWAGPVPSPESHFGHPMGADRIVLDWEKVVSYYRALERADSRVRVDEIGRSTEGRPFLVVTVASSQTIQNLGRYREVQRRLADPRLTTGAEAETLVAEGRSVVLITCSIHATEIGSSHAAVEFVHRLLTEDKPRFRAILDNTIFLLVPSLNPDGMDLVTRWYRKTLGTPFEGTSPPELYHKYVGHDNNRDWYIFSQAETRHTISKIHNVWHPQIVYDMHQQGTNASRIFVPPWMDPIEPNVDAILAQQSNQIGIGMAVDLTAAGKTGVAINATYDFWTPGRHYQSYHGGMRILSEVASAKIATPVVVRREQLDREATGYNARQSSWNHLEPWPGGEWRLKDIVDYSLIAMESCLYQAAIHREDLLRNFYRIGTRQIARSTPWGYRIPARQRDPGATRKLLETLEFGQVEIEQDRDANCIIRMAQPYSGFAKTLLERQQYPDLRQYPGGPPRRPYDVTAHTLPLLMGVSVDTLDTPLAGELTRFVAQPQRTGAVLPAADTDSWREVNKAWSAGRTVWRNAISGDFALGNLGADWKRLERPKVALYQGYVANMDEGWTRWLLEQFGFRYTSAGNRDIQAGGLRNRFDTIVFADASPSQISDGYKPGMMPEEYTGGLGTEGAKALSEFAQNGGTLVFLNRASAYAVEKLGLKVKNVLNGVRSTEFYCPGSLLTVNLDTRHPLAYGLPAEIPIWFENSPAWEVDASTVARYPAANLLASGWLLGEKRIASSSSLLDVRTGRGHVVLFGMRPQYRAQSYLTFKLLFNSLCL